MGSIAFLFPGQGSQFIGMGRELASMFPEAKAVMQEVDEALKFNLSQLMFSGDIDELTLTVNAQPAIMAVSMAVLKVLKTQKILAKDIALSAGHSLGEYSALCATGAFNVSQTARLLQIRGKAMQEAVPQGQGAMVALLGAELENAHSLALAASKYGMCEIANDNGAGQFVLSGDMDAIDYAIEHAKEHSVKKAIKLNVSAPFHSSLMKPAAEKMREALAAQAIGKFAMPVVANFTAQINNDPELVPELLVQQICGRVRWRESMLVMQQSEITHFIEIGPGKVLSTLARRMELGCEVYSIHDPKDIDLYVNSL